MEGTKEVLAREIVDELMRRGRLKLPTTPSGIKSWREQACTDLPAFLAKYARGMDAEELIDVAVRNAACHDVSEEMGKLLHVPGKKR